MVLMACWHVKIDLESNAVFHNIEFASLSEADLLLLQILCLLPKAAGPDVAPFLTTNFVACSSFKKKLNLINALLH